MNNNIYNAGDMFAIKFDEETYIPGRVLLNIQSQCLDSGIVGGLDSTLGSCYSNIKPVYLVELYKCMLQKPEKPSTREILFDCVVVDQKSPKKKNWIYLGNEPVDPELIEFPEVISYSIGEGYRIVKGEIGIILPENDWDSFIRETKTTPSVMSSKGISTYSLYQMGFIDKVKAKFSGDRDLTYLSNLGSNLRLFNNHRNKLFKMIGEDPNESYHQMALKHGFDLKRFYKS